MTSTSGAGATIVQLPFPSMSDPHEEIQGYYRRYSTLYGQVFPNFFVPERDLWELPIWVAHVGAMLTALGYQPTFADLSGVEPRADACREVLGGDLSGQTFLMSPLAQNFTLAKDLSRHLIADGARTVIGGNMAPLATAEDASVVHVGTASLESLGTTLGAAQVTPAVVTVPVRLGRGEAVDLAPDYSLLATRPRRLPMMRLNASHGCLYTCSFCGDAWSRQLRVVDRSALEAELVQIESLFPDVDTLYIGDKTFGQSRQAVANLAEVLEDRRFRLIVQTHVLQVDDGLIDTMCALGVEVVELGFESADTELLTESGKASKGLSFFEDRVERLAASGLRVVLNVLGGLPSERPKSHQTTIDAMRRWSPIVWLYNLYNFVPYPLTPYFPSLRERIVDWDFAHWREDGPPVFEPYHQTIDQSWKAFLEKVAVGTEILDERLARETSS